MARTREEALQGVANQVEALQGVINGLDALHGAINGLPRVAEAIAVVPINERLKALTAAEASYRRSALELGYSDSEVRDWVTAIMFSLRTHVLARQSSEEKPSEESVPIDLPSAA